MTALVRRLWRKRFLRSLGALFVLLGSYVGMRTLAEHMADSVDVAVHTAQVCCDSAGPLIFARAIANARTARQVQAAVNSTLVVRPNASINCDLGYDHPPYYVFHLAFRVQGIVVEVANTDPTIYCGIWTVTTLGMPPPGLDGRVDPGNLLPELHQLTGMPIPRACNPC